MKALLRKFGLHKLFFGEVLVKEKVINDKQLQEALALQEKKRQLPGQVFRIGQMIVDVGYAKEDDVVSAINNHFGIPAKQLSDDIEGLIKENQSSGWRRFFAQRVSIRIQLSIAITFVVMFTILILTWVVLSRQRAQLYQQTLQTGKVSLNYFVNNARESLLKDDILKLNMLINEAASVEGLLYAIIIDRKQIVKAHTDHKMIGKPLEVFENMSGMTTEKDLNYFNYRLYSGANVLNLSRAVKFKNKDIGTVHVGISLDFISKQILRETISIVALSLVIVIVGISVAFMLGISFSRPISELVLATKEIGKGNFGHKISVIRKDEFGDLALSFNYMCRELSMKSWLQETFGRYVSPGILEMIMAHPEDSWLKGTRSEASILFTDIRGFTSFSETREPEKVVDALNEYFSIATHYILEYGGYVDKFIGDAVLGVFGVPVPSTDHAERAVKAAFYMQKELQERGKKGNELLSRIGIGINSGVVVSGNIGSSVKMEYTVIGDSVNVASRLNGLAGAGEIIISQSTFLPIKDLISVKPLPPQTVKGKAEPIGVFSLLDLKENKG